MKDQYTGDVNDYGKYGLLRALADAYEGRLHVCWMLTPADGRTDGSRLAYLSDAPRFREFDPPLFDVLAGLVSCDRRTVQAVAAANVLSGATFHADILPDAEVGRQRYFADVRSRLGPAELVFFDPDNGLEVSSVPRGRRNSSKYLYWDEFVNALGEGRAVCVYQHFPRRPRGAFVAALLDRVGELAPDHFAFAVTSPSVAFLICAPTSAADRLFDAAGAVVARPGSRFGLRVRTRPQPYRGKKLALCRQLQ